MRPIHVVRMDKTRPAVILTRGTIRAHLSNVTVAPITTTVRGISTEVPVGRRNGLDQDSVISCDTIGTVPASAVGAVIGALLPSQEQQLTAAIAAAFDLEEVEWK